ncbi:MAG: hypothetical protein J2P36_12325 [Ktedonobacteraceae bacterium]|nr:hypothetical protein [Ktedonobacteraceae bacterium]
MELTRLRRLLRDMPDYGLEALTLLDAVDQVYESAEVSLEDRLKDGQYPEDGDFQTFVEKQVDHLIGALAGLESVGTTGVIRVLMDHYGTARIAQEVANCKEQIDESVKAFLLSGDDALGDLDDHPF